MCFKTSLRAKKFSYENKYNFHGNARVGGTNFDMIGFAEKLVLTHRQNVTRNLPKRVLIIDSYLTGY